MNIPVLGEGKVNCEFAVAAYLSLVLNRFMDSLTAGRLVYDGNALQTCIDDYGTQSCDLLRGLDSSVCPGIVVPQVAQGDACGLSEECIDGYCDGGTSASNPVGQCVPKKQTGAGCAAAAECVSGNCDANTNLCAEAAAPTALCGG